MASHADGPTRAVHDLAIITISTNEAHWLSACLSSVYAHQGAATLDVIVADNESTDGTRELVESEFPKARVITCVNRGFSHANNRALMAADARYLLFLNPDTEILDGSFGELVQALDERPGVGLAGVRQVTPDGSLFPTVRRFPSPTRALFEALGSERLPFRASWLGERELRLERYESELQCDWTSGSFMIARKEALVSAGAMDERFFIYSEEPDLCLRIKKAGWDVRHLPTMTILHHAGKAGLNPRMLAQETYARRQYAMKHFSTLRRVAFTAAIGLGLVLRLVTSRDAARRSAYTRALGTLMGFVPHRSERRPKWRSLRRRRSRTTPDGAFASCGACSAHRDLPFAEQADPVAALRPVLDKLLRRAGLAKLAPEFRHAANCILRPVDDVVEGDQAARRHQRGVQLVVTPDPLRRVVTVDEEEVDGTPGKLAHYPLQRGRGMRVSRQEHDLLPFTRARPIQRCSRRVVSSSVAWILRCRKVHRDEQSVRRRHSREEEERPTFSCADLDDRRRRISAQDVEQRSDLPLDLKRGDSEVIHAEIPRERKVGLEARLCSSLLDHSRCCANADPIAQESEEL